MGLRSLEEPLVRHSSQNCDAFKENTHKGAKLPTFSLPLFWFQIHSVMMFKSTRIEHSSFLFWQIFSTKNGYLKTKRFGHVN